MKYPFPAARHAVQSAGHRLSDTEGRCNYRYTRRGALRAAQTQVERGFYGIEFHTWPIRFNWLDAPTWKYEFKRFWREVSHV